MIGWSFLLDCVKCEDGVICEGDSAGSLTESLKSKLILLRF